MWKWRWANGYSIQRILRCLFLADWITLSERMNTNKNWHWSVGYSFIRLTHPSRKEMYSHAGSLSHTRMGKKCLNLRKIYQFSPPSLFSYVLKCSFFSVLCCSVCFIAYLPNIGMNGPLTQFVLSGPCPFTLNSINMAHPFSYHSE